MKKNILYISLLVAAMTSCSDNGAIQVDDTMLENKVSIEIDDYVYEDGTRANYTFGDKRVGFVWSADDKVGVFPTVGHQALFTLKEGAGSSTALIEGGDWALRPNSKYVAYYPYYQNTPNKEKIMVDVTDGKSDFMYSGFQTTDAKGNVNFSMKHLTSLVELNIWMPKMGDFADYTITATGGEFVNKGWYALTGGDSDVNPIATTKSVTIHNEPSKDGFKLSTFFMLLPADMSSSKFTLTVSGNQMQTPTSASTIDKGYLLDNLSYTYTFKPFEGKKFERNKAYSIDVKPYDYVDLGLESGNLWATCNIGADSETDCGYYIMWGELKPRETRDKYTNNNYDWFDANRKLKKYNNDATASPGMVDNKKVLDLVDDAAYQLWGEEWRIPSKADFVELKNSLTWEKTEKNGVVGYLGTATNGKQIFFPAAGEIKNNLGISEQGQKGYYVTRELWEANSSVNPKQCATGEFIMSGSKATISTMNQNRDNGMTIRAVKYTKK